MVFMVPYWSTVTLIAILAIVSWVGLAIANEYAVKSRVTRTIVRVGIILSSLALVLGFLGIWIPFFIPGLY